MLIYYAWTRDLYVNRKVDRGNDGAAQGKMIVASPCVRNCCLNEADICLGCGRSLEEIKYWNRADSSEKYNILNRAQKRKQAAK